MDTGAKKPDENSKSAFREKAVDWGRACLCAIAPLMFRLEKNGRCWLGKND